MDTAFFNNIRVKETWALDANFLFTVTFIFSLPILTFVQKLCSHSGWLLLKWSVIGFNGAETNCRIAHVLGILLMISY